jgi:hypothetical protein
MAKQKKDKMTIFIKTLYTENKRLRNTNPTEKKGGGGK